MPETRPQILVVSDFFPKNVQQCTNGVFQRMRLFLEAFAEFGDLQLLFYVPETVAVTTERAEECAADIGRYWDLRASVQLCRLGPPVKPNSIFNAALLRGPYGRRTEGKEQLEALSNMLARDPAVIVIHRLSAAHALLRVGKPSVPVFFDLDDVEHVAFFRSIRQPPTWRSKPILYLQIPAIIWLERRIAVFSQATFVCSERDANHLRTIWRMPRVVVVPNAVKVPAKKVPGTSTHTIVFVGALGYRPNAIAADYLVERVWPLIRAALPSARLVIVGSLPESTYAYHTAANGVEFRGFVSDLAEVYANAGVACCPVWSGGGTRLKILEAAAFGIPIVATTFAAQGIAFKDQVEILLRDDPQSIADACVTVLTDRPLSDRLSRAARATVERLYERQGVIAGIRRTVAPIISAARRTGLKGTAVG